MTSGSENRERFRHLTIRLTLAERAAIDSAADRSGQTAGSYARAAILGVPLPRQVRRPPIERRELARLLGQLGKIGSNVNQIAVLANSGEGVNPIELDAAKADIRAMRDAVLAALGRGP